MVGQIDEFKILNNDNNLGLKFHFARGSGQSININNISLSAPGQPATKNFARNFGGFKKIIRVDFTLFNDGTDKSTDGSNKVTLSEQEDHLMDDAGVVQGNSNGQSSVTYTVTVFRDGASKTYNGAIEDITVDATLEDNPLVLNGSFNLTQGQ